MSIDADDRWTQTGVLLDTTDVLSLTPNDDNQIFSKAIIPAYTISLIA